MERNEMFIININYYTDKYINLNIFTDLKISINILKLIISNSYIIFNENNEIYDQYRIKLRDTLHKLKYIQGTINKDKISKLSIFILERYYRENKCVAYKLDNTRCINTIKKSNVCGIHVRYPTKIVKMLTKYVPVDISKKCVELL